MSISCIFCEMVFLQIVFRKLTITWLPNLWPGQNCPLLKNRNWKKIRVILTWSEMGELSYYQFSKKKHILKNLSFNMNCMKWLVWTPLWWMVCHFYKTASDFKISTLCVSASSACLASGAKGDLMTSSTEKLLKLTLYKKALIGFDRFLN